MFSDPFMLFYVIVGGLLALFAIAGIIVGIAKYRQKKHTAYSLTTTGSDRSAYAKRLVRRYDNDIE